MASFGNIEQLFEALFTGDTRAKTLCTAIDEVGAGIEVNGLEFEAETALLSSIGIANQADILKLVDEMKLAAYNSRKNNARVAFHATQRKALEAKLIALISETFYAVEIPDIQSSPGNFDVARTMLRSMITKHGLVAVALLQGVKAVLLRQASASSRIHWHLKREHLINGGICYLESAISLLQVCGFEPVQPDVLNLEAGTQNDGGICWALRTLCWSRSQLRSLASTIRQDGDVAPAGKLTIAEINPTIVDTNFELVPESWLNWCNVL